MRSYHFYAFLAIVIWATSYIGTKVVSDVFSSYSLALIRCGVGSVILGAYLLVEKMPCPRRGDWPLILLSGMIGLGIYLAIFSKGVALLNPTACCIVIATAPIISAFFAAILFREHLSWLGWTAIGMAFCGILVLSLWDSSLSFNVGFYWIQAGAIILAMYNLCQRKLTRIYPAAMATAYSYFAGAAVLLIFLPGTVAEVKEAVLWQNLVAVGLGVFPGALAYLLWSQALSITPKTSYVTNYMFLTPFFAGLMEYAVVAQLPDAGTVIGGTVILASLAVFSLEGRKKAV